MTTARMIMTREVIGVAPEHLVSEAIEHLESKGVSGAPVVAAGGKLVGVVSLKDLLHAAGTPGRGAARLRDFYAREAGQDAALHELEGAVDLKVEVIMNPEPITVDEDAPLETVAACMLRHGIHRVLVTDADRLVGIVSALDFVRLFAADASST